MSTGVPIVKILKAADAENEMLVGALVAVVNEAFSKAEGNILLENYRRTDTEELKGFIVAEEIAALYTPASSKPIGCIRIKQCSPTSGEWAMLALDVGSHGSGLGRALVAFAEDELRSRGVLTVQITLLYPRDFEHPVKKRLQNWYERMGYEMVGVEDFLKEYPHIAVQLTCSCEYRVLEKSLK